MHENVQPAARYDRLCLGGVNFRMSTSSFRVWILIPLLTLFVAALTLMPCVSRTDVVLAPSTESSAGGATDAWLVTRGLIARGMFGEQSGSDILTPPPGTEVDETRQTENLTGEVLNRVKSWNEMVADDTIHIEVTTLSTYQFEVAFWLFPNHRKGCTIYQWTLYDHGRALQSAFWRNDATVLRLAGAADLPHDCAEQAVMLETDAAKARAAARQYCRAGTTHGPVAESFDSSIFWVCGFVGSQLAVAPNNARLCYGFCTSPVQTTRCNAGPLT